MLRLTPEIIKKAIDSYQNGLNTCSYELISQGDCKKLRPAAVMIPLLEMENGWHVLLTHRSEMLDEHRGQVAFPGGAREAEDQNLGETALREMQEEVGVCPADVDVFGHLGDRPIITGFIVRPFVGQIPWPYYLKVDSNEVQSAFIVPLEWLRDPGNRYIRYRSIAGRELPVIYFKPYDGHQLWGASAEMMVTLLSALGLVNA